MTTLADELMEIEERLCADLLKLHYNSPVKFVYNPIDHAKELHHNFLSRFYDGGERSVMFLGMNPGPWGMNQTGVPFGEVNMVRDLLKISGPVTPPVNQHPKRKVEGLDCKRSEVSGRRFWSFIKAGFFWRSRFGNMNSWIHLTQSIS